MLKVLDWIMKNYIWVGAILTFMFILTITGSLTDLLRGAKKGLQQIFTPLGFTVLAIIIIIGIILYSSLKNAIT